MSTADITHQARKRFGQNFLHDQNVIDRIVKSIQPRPDDWIVEIGPGLGALTAPLLATTAHLTAIELDRNLASLLREKFPHLRLVEGDALKTDFSLLMKNPTARKAKIIGNLPYNISTPLIFHLLSFKNDIEAMYFMLQREVVERMAAQPHNKTYGKLSIMTQYHCEVAPLFHIAPTCFRPVPKVESTLVALIPRAFPLTANDPVLFEQLVSTAFQQRRKTLRNALRNLIPETLAPTLADTLSRRAENLSVEEYVLLSNQLGAYTTGSHPH